MDDLLAEFRHKNVREENPEDLPTYRYRFGGTLDPDDAGLNAYQETQTPLFEEGGLRDRISLDQSSHQSSQSSSINDGESSTFTGSTNKISANFRRCLSVLHEQDTVRDDYIREIAQENEGLVHEVDELKRALEANSSTTSSDAPHIKAEMRTQAAERNLWEARQAMARHHFVYVLIDGGGYRFPKDLLQAGASGGAEAARRMERAIEVQSTHFESADDLKIVINIFINVEDMFMGFVSSGVFQNESAATIRDFARGFTESRPCYSMVEVGPGPGRGTAVSKISELLYLFVNNVQCKRVFLGCSHENDYVPVLAPYISNPVLASRIALVESGKSNCYFETLPFEVVELLSVFEAPSHGPAHNTLHISHKDEGGPAEQGQTMSPGLASGIETWRKSTTSLSNNAYYRQSDTREAQSVWGAGHSNAVLLNIDDERLDEDLGKIDPAIEYDMTKQAKQQLFCKSYHLRGTAVCQIDACSFRHGPSLNTQETKVLRMWQRKHRCQQGTQCRQVGCLLGHICPYYEGECPFGYNCHFKSTHGIDRTVVKVWKA